MHACYTQVFRFPGLHTYCWCDIHTCINNIKNACMLAIHRFLDSLGDNNPFSNADKAQEKQQSESIHTCVYVLYLGENICTCRESFFFLCATSAHAKCVCVCLCVCVCVCM